MQITDPKSPFRGWYDVVVRHGPVKFEHYGVITPGMDPSVHSWLVENVGRVGRDTWIPGGVDKSGRHVLIKNAQKAMLFKLTWARL